MIVERGGAGCTMIDLWSLPPLYHQSHLSVVEIIHHCLCSVWEIPAKPMWIYSSTDIVWCVCVFLIVLSAVLVYMGIYCFKLKVVYFYWIWQLSGDSHILCNVSFLTDD